MASGDRDRLCGLAVLDLDDFEASTTLTIRSGMADLCRRRLAAIAEQGSLSAGSVATNSWSSSIASRMKAI
jgi:hypothetical protein